MSTSLPLLELDRLAIGGLPGASPVVDGLSLSVAPGSSLGIAGESGCGKSTLLLAMMGVVKPGLRRRSGHCRFRGVDLFGGDERAVEKLRGGRLALVPQNAGLALTPNIRVGDQVAEALDLHTDLPPDRHRERVAELLGQVGLPAPGRLARRFPHELSGGQLQRVGIAMALAGEPDLLLLDEPTTGLDVTTQLGILRLLIELRTLRNLAMVCVSHDLGVIAALCERMAVMYSGRIVESGPTARLLERPAHPYTHGLLAAIPRLSARRIPAGIAGLPPAPEEPLPGCRFAPRCAHAAADCRSAAPALASAGTEREVACWHPLAGDPDLAPLASEPIKTEPEPTQPQIAIANLTVTYQRSGIADLLLSRTAKAPAVDEVSLVLRKGEVLGIVGESGSGKSTLLRSIAGLWPIAGGTIAFNDGIDLGGPAGKRDPATLRAIQLIFQNPDASLNPRHTIREILAQPLRLYFRLSAPEIAECATVLLSDVRLDASYLDRYPGDLSGGEKQRVAIARAFAANPDVILCDEITSALDVSVQASVLRLIRELVARRGVACLFVSHDLAVVQALADRIAVLYRGRLVEIGPARAVCEQPRHPYTRALIAAVLEPGGDAPAAAAGAARGEDEIGSQGCAYAGRCSSRLERCLTRMPSWHGADADEGAGHGARCHLLAGNDA